MIYRAKLDGTRYLGWSIQISGNYFATDNIDNASCYTTIKDLCQAIEAAKWWMSEYDNAFNPKVTIEGEEDGIFYTVKKRRANR